MGNTFTAGKGDMKAKVMKINGEFFKIKTPAKAGDIIKDYPGHVLIDSDDFLQFKLRAQTLYPQSELRPKKIYLLVQLPRFPASEDPETELDLQRKKRQSIKVRLPKSEVERIVQQSRDNVEAAEKIIDLFRRADDETTEEMPFSNCFTSFLSFISHRHSKYEKLTND